MIVFIIQRVRCYGPSTLGDKAGPLLQGTVPYQMNYNCTCLYQTTLPAGSVWQPQHGHKYNYLNT